MRLRSSCASCGRMFTNSVVKLRCGRSEPCSCTSDTHSQRKSGRSRACSNFGECMKSPEVNNLYLHGSTPMVAPEDAP